MGGEQQGQKVDGLAQDTQVMLSSRQAD